MNLSVMGLPPEERTVPEPNAPHVTLTLLFLSAQPSQVPAPGQGALGVDQVPYSPETQH